MRLVGAGWHRVQHWDAERTDLRREVDKERLLRPLWVDDCWAVAKVPEVPRRHEAAGVPEGGAGASNSRTIEQQSNGTTEQQNSRTIAIDSEKNPAEAKPPPLESWLSA